VAKTYEPIASQTLGSNTTTVSFSSIASSWTDLRLIVSGRSTRTSVTYESIWIRFNADSGSNYSDTYLYGSGSSAGSGRSSNLTRVQIARFNHSASSNTTPSAVIIDVQSYANTSVYKTVLGQSASSVENWPVSRYVGLWRSTSAITSIDLTVEVDQFASGSTFSLYGIKAA